MRSLTILVLLGVFQSGVAAEQSLYFEMLRMQTDSATLGPSERARRARAAAVRFFDKYSRAKHLYFEADHFFRGCVYGSEESRSPEETWKENQKRLHCEYWMTPEAQRLELVDHSTTAKAVHYLWKGVYTERILPLNGFPAQQETYLFDIWKFTHRRELLDKGKLSREDNLRLGNYQCRGEIDGYTWCEVAQYRAPWVGKNALRTRLIRDKISSGIWIGKATRDQQECDVIIWEAKDDPRSERQAFYIDRDGFLRLRNIIWDVEDLKIDRFFRTRYYSRFSTKEIPPQMLDPTGRSDQPGAERGKHSLEQGTQEHCEERR
jgi:hypothetical protein